METENNPNKGYNENNENPNLETSNQEIENSEKKNLNHPIIDETNKNIEVIQNDLIVDQNQINNNNNNINEMNDNNNNIKEMNDNNNNINEMNDNNNNINEIKDNNNNINTENNNNILNNIYSNTENNNNNNILNDNNNKTENNNIIVNDINSNSPQLTNESETLVKTLYKIRNEITNKTENINKIDDKLDEMTKINKQDIINKLNKKKFILKNLHKKSSSLQINLHQLDKAQLKLENESYMSIPLNTIEIIKKDRLKSIRNEKRSLILKLHDIDDQINTIVYQENKTHSKKDIIKKFLDNFENDKEHFSEAMMTINRNIYKRRKERNEERLKEEEEYEKKNKEESNLKKRDEELKKIEFMNNQKKLEEKIKEKNNKIINHVRKFINGSPSYKDKNYITSEEKELIRKQDENNYLKIQLAKRKDFYKPISSRELNNFAKEVIINEKKTFAELEQKKIQLEDLFKERKELLPKYQSHFYKNSLEKDKEFLNRENNRIEKINEQKQKIKIFGEGIKKFHFPKSISEKLKKQRENIISNLKGENRIEKIKDLKKQIQKANNKYQIFNTISSQDLKKKNPIKVNNDTLSNDKRKITKSKDYLTLMRKERELKNNKLSMSADNKEQWDKMMKNNKNNRNIFDNIYDIQEKSNQLQREAEFKTQLYNLDPKKNAKMRNEISDLYIGSIQAKLKIIKTIQDKEYEDHFN